MNKLNKRTAILYWVFITVLLLPTITAIAYAQYLGNVGEEGETGSGTLEENLELARRRVEAAQANPASGSGTPYLDAGGVVGASIIAGAVFGGIAAAFFFKGRSGRYVAPGRG